MSILCLVSSQAMSAVRRRGPSPVSCRVHSRLQPRVAVVLLMYLACTVFHRMWDSAVTAGGYPGKVEQAMFGPPFLDSSSCGGE